MRGGYRGRGARARYLAVRTDLPPPYHPRRTRNRPSTSIVSSPAAGTSVPNAIIDLTSGLFATPAPVTPPPTPPPMNNSSISIETTAASLSSAVPMPQNIDQDADMPDANAPTAAEVPIVVG